MNKKIFESLAIVIYNISYTLSAKDNHFHHYSWGVRDKTSWEENPFINLTINANSFRQV